MQSKLVIGTDRKGGVKKYMADYFEKEEEQKPVVEAQPEKIKLGEKEYSQDELSQLVGLGESYREIETKYNTKLDRVWPEYSKSQNRVKELEAEMEKIKQAQSAPKDLDENSIKEAKEAARKIGLVTDEQFADFMGKNFRQFYQQERAAERLLDDCKDFEGEYDGKDGRPAFKTEEILNYMNETGIKNPELAYKTKYEPQLDSWKATELSKAKKPGLTTVTDTEGYKVPSNVKVTRDNLQDLIREQLEG